MVKSKELIFKEKIWNIFKNIDENFNDKIDQASIKIYFSKNNLPYNEQEILKHINDPDKINFPQFFNYCEAIKLIS